MSIYLVGILGAFVLIAGYAYPVKEYTHALKSPKNLLLAGGGFLMLLYSILNYIFLEGALFFIFLQVLINGASILMLINVPEKISIPIISIAALTLIIWSYQIEQSLSTYWFIFGLSIIAIGYVLKSGTWRRNASFCIGSLCVAAFSFLVPDWIFFGLNSVAAMFSGFYTLQLLKKNSS